LTTIVDVVKDTLFDSIVIAESLKWSFSVCHLFTNRNVFNIYWTWWHVRGWGLIAIPRLSVKPINVYGTKDELSMPVFDNIDGIFQTLVCFKAKRMVLSKYEETEFRLLCSYVVFSFDEFSQHSRRCEENNKHLI